MPATESAAMKHIEVTDKLPLTEVLEQARDDDVVLTRQGHAVVVVKAIDDEELEWYARESEPEFLASLARARAQVKKGEVVRHEDLKHGLGIE